MFHVCLQFGASLSKRLAFKLQLVNRLNLMLDLVFGPFESFLVDGLSLRSLSKVSFDRIELSGKILDVFGLTLILLQSSMCFGALEQCKLALGLS